MPEPPSGIEESAVTSLALYSGVYPPWENRAMKRQKVTKMYCSEIAGAVHEMMEGLHAVGLIGDSVMAEFDSSCRIPAISAEKVET